MHVAADGRRAGGGRKRERPAPHEALRLQTQSLSKPTRMTASKEWTSLWRPDEKRHLAQLVENEKMEHKNIQLGMILVRVLYLVFTRRSPLSVDSAVFTLQFGIFHL